MVEKKCCKKNVWDEYELLSGEEATCETPDAPTGLTATEITSTRIDLSWTAPAQTVTGYKIERQVDDGTWNTLIADTGNTNVTYSDTSVTAGTINTYRVTAINESCMSVASGTAEDYAFSNADARTGYNAVVTGNGGAINYSIYDTNPRTVKVKEGLDNFFVTAVTDGWKTDLRGCYLFFGGSAGAHAINIFNAGTYNLTFVNTPTQGKDGTTFNGSSQYATTNGYIENTHGTLNNTHVSSLTSNVSSTGIDSYIGASSGTSQRIQIIHQTSGTVLQFSAYTSTNGAGRLETTTARNQFLIGSRTASNSYKIYANGVSIASATDSGGTRPTVQHYIGALNSSGSPTNYVDGTFRFASMGLGLTDAKALSLYNALTTFNAILGR